MLDSIDQPIPSTLPRATPVHWPTQEAHEIRMAQTSCIRCCTREMRQTILKYLTQISQTNSTGTLNTNIHRLRQCMRDASYALTLIYPYLCPSSLVQRHNSGWCDWESEPLPESLLLHHSRPESFVLAFMQCWSWLIMIDWYQVDTLIQYIDDWSIHTNLCLDRSFCTVHEASVHLRSAMKSCIRDQIWSGHWGRAPNQQHACPTWQATTKQILHNDIQWQWFTTETQIVWKEFLGNEGTLKTATQLTCFQGWSHQFRHTNPSNNKTTTVWHPFADFSQSIRACNWCPCKNTPSNPVVFSFQRLLVAIRGYGEHCCTYTAGTLLNGNHYATSIVEEATVHDLLQFCLLDCPPYPCTSILLSLLSDIHCETQVTCESLKTMLVQQVAKHTPGYCTKR